MQNGKMTITVDLPPEYKKVISENNRLKKLVESQNEQLKQQGRRLRKAEHDRDRYHERLLDYMGAIEKLA